MPITSLSLNVVGVAYSNQDGGNRRSEIMFCDPGEPVDLRPEPKNPVDPQAVAVFSARGFQIGYLTAERAPWIGSMIRDGRQVSAIFQQDAPWGAVIRVGLDGHEPRLPEIIADDEEAQETEGADYDPGYFPDDLPADE